MSDTQYYKTVTMANRAAITVETALIGYINEQHRAKRLMGENREYSELVDRNIERAQEALAAMRAGVLSKAEE